jgi:hypothetical protein
LEPKALQGTVVGYARNSVGLRVLMAGVPFRDRHAIVESNSVVCHEGIRGVNGTSFDSNIVITTTDGFDDLGTWHRIKSPGVFMNTTNTGTPSTPQTVDSPTPSSQVDERGVDTTSDEPPPLIDIFDDDDDPPLAIYMDQQIEDRDLGDLLTAAHKVYATRARNTEPLTALTDRHTFTFHDTSGSASSTHGGAPSTRERSGGHGEAMLRNKTPKNLLATSVKGGFMGSLHRSVTGGHQALSYTQQFNAMGGKHAKLVEALKVPRNAEAWNNELNSLLANGNLVMMNITDVPPGYKPIGYAAAFKDK